MLKNQSPSNREQIVNFKIDETAKCVCFCEQRLGRQQKCHHAMSEDVDVITEIIMEQANDFLIADQHTKEDINML